jgi:hypothetical protein
MGTWLSGIPELTDLSICHDPVEFCQCRGSGRYQRHLNEHVHSYRCSASCWEYGAPLDLRGQCERPAWTGQVPGLLFVWGCDSFPNTRVHLYDFVNFHVGASGAIAAVLGAYLALYPRSRIATIFPVGFLLHLIMIPSSIVLGFCFVLQILNGVWRQTLVTWAMWPFGLTLVVLWHGC